MERESGGKGAETEQAPASGPAEHPHGAGPSVSELLTRRYDSLGLAERAAALLHAREAGKRAAEYARSREELETGPVEAYQTHVVAAAAQDGRLESEVAASWRRACDEGKAFRDPRVQAFLFGWHERGTEILAEIEAGDGDEPARAQWFVKSLKP